MMLQLTSTASGYGGSDGYDGLVAGILLSLWPSKSVVPLTCSLLLLGLQRDRLLEAPKMPRAVHGQARGVKELCQRVGAQTNVS